MKQLSLFFIVIMLASCNLSPTGALAPKPFRMGKPESGSKMFNLGWEQGCETGMSTMTPSAYKAFYRYKQEPSLITNREYYNAWIDSYTYCRQYAFKWAFWAWDEDNASLDFK